MRLLGDWLTRGRKLREEVDECEQVDVGVVDGEFDEDGASVDVHPFDGEFPEQTAGLSLGRAQVSHVAAASVVTSAAVRRQALHID